MATYSPDTRRYEKSFEVGGGSGGKRPTEKGFPIAFVSQMAESESRRKEHALYSDASYSPEILV